MDIDVVPLASFMHPVLLEGGNLEEGDAGAAFGSVMVGELNCSDAPTTLGKQSLSDNNTALRLPSFSSIYCIILSKR